MTEPTPEEPTPADPEPAAPPKPANKLLGYGVLAGALVLAVAVGGYLLVSGGGDSKTNTPANLDASQVRQLLGDPTPQPDTGVLDPQRPEEGKKAPDFALTDARDPSVVHKLSDYKGKTVILNWYASWCGPCQKEIPDLQKVYDSLNGQVVVLGIDFMEDNDAATSILNDLKASYPAVADSSGVVSEHYRVGQGGASGLPSSFFVDKDGILRASVIGQLTKDKLQSGLAKAGVTYSPQ